MSLGFNSGGLFSFSTRGSWSLPTTPWSGFITTGGFRLFPSLSSCGSPPNSPHRSRIGTLALCRQARHIQARSRATIRFGDTSFLIDEHISIVKELRTHDRNGLSFRHLDLAVRSAVFAQRKD